MKSIDVYKTSISKDTQEIRKVLEAITTSVQYCLLMLKCDKNITYELIWWECKGVLWAGIFLVGLWPCLLYLH